MKRHSGVMHLNCVDRALLAFQVDATGQRISFSLILSVQGEPDAGRLTEAILSTARARPKLMTTLCGGSLQHYRRVHEEFVGEILEVQGLAAVQARHDSTEASIGSLYDERISEWINRPLDTRRSLPFRILLLRKGAAGKTTYKMPTDTWITITHPSRNSKLLY